MKSFQSLHGTRKLTIIDVVNGELVVTLDATNDDVESEALDYLAKECGYTWEEATTKWNKTKLESEEN